MSAIGTTMTSASLANQHECRWLCKTALAVNQPQIMETQILLIELVILVVVVAVVVIALRPPRQ